jgi:citrate lyase subunit beta/citryl-CoA lyase
VTLAPRGVQPGTAARSYLYVPGDVPDRFPKAAGSGADAVILDLEDAVAVARKNVARQYVGAYLAEAATGVQWWVRIDASFAETDVRAVVKPASRLTGLVVPKAEVELLRHLDNLLAELEERSGRSRGSLPLVGLIETAQGMTDVQAIARCPRLVALGLGEADLAAELGLWPGPDRVELWPLRMQLVLASAVAGLRAPIGPVDTNVRGTDDLEGTTRQLLRQGYRARTAIHPKQVAAINAVFTPTEDELRDAQRTVADYEQQLARGSGVATTATGQFVDVAVLRSAREVLQRAKAPHDAS